MTGEIKFRAFGYENKNMIDVGHIEFLEDGSFIINEELPTDFQGKKLWELMQYTGLKDKNGKEIYEGDIVKVIEEDGGAYIKRKESYQIVFDEKNASFMLSEYYHMNYFSSWIIIGNIYQNPELLK